MVCLLRQPRDTDTSNFQLNIIPIDGNTDAFPIGAVLLQKWAVSHQNRFKMRILHITQMFQTNNEIVNGALLCVTGN